MPSASTLRIIGEKLRCGADSLLWGAEAAKFHAAVMVPTPSLDKRIGVLPEAMREFVLLALERAEQAAKRVPIKYLRPPTNENWPEYAAYLESLSKMDRL